MPLNLAFWILMLLWLVLGVIPVWAPDGQPNYRVVGGNLLLFILIGMLGWHAFGAPLHG
jgi:hypothetical protein